MQQKSKTSIYIKMHIFILPGFFLGGVVVFFLFFFFVCLAEKPVRLLKCCRLDANASTTVVFVCPQGPRSRCLRRGLRGPGGGDPGGAQSPAGGGEGESPSRSPPAIKPRFPPVLMCFFHKDASMIFRHRLSLPQTLPEVCSEQDELDFLMEALIIR